MRNPNLLLLIIVFILAPFKLSAAADTVAVRETRIPVLIERQDNELFHLRIEAAQSQMLNETTHYPVFQSTQEFGFREQQPYLPPHST